MTDLTAHLYQLVQLQCRLNALELDLYPKAQHPHCWARQAQRLIPDDGPPSTEPTMDAIVEASNAVDTEQEATQAPIAPPTESPTVSTENTLIPIVASARRRRPSRSARNRRQPTPIPPSEPELHIPDVETDEPSEPTELAAVELQPIDVLAELVPLEMEPVAELKPSTEQEAPPSFFQVDNMVTDLGIDTSHTDTEFSRVDFVAPPESIVPIPKEEDSLDHLESSEILFLDDISSMLSDIPDDLTEIPSPLELKPDLDNLPSVLPTPSNETPSFKDKSAFEEDDQLLHSDEVMLDIIHPSPLLHEDLEGLSDQLDLQPDNMSLWLARAKLWYQKGDLAAAISDCYRALQLKQETFESQKLLEQLLTEANIPQYRALLLPK